MVDGRTAVHEACKEGYSAVLEVLLEYDADLEIMVCVCVWFVLERERLLNIQSLTLHRTAME